MCIIIMSKGYVVELLICFDIAQPPNNTLIANLDMNEKSNFEIIALMNKLILPLMEWHTITVNHLHPVQLLLLTPTIIIII